MLSFSSKYYLKIIKYLKDDGGKARIVGGAVRDAILGISGADIDIATDLTPDQVTNILQERGVKVIPTGIKFGTITAVVKGESFEITTLRSDISCDGRHADVQYSNDFEEDAKRRDFTINALSYCPIERKIFDYFGGIEDIKLGRVVFIGNAYARIQEDYLRILRFFRFSCLCAKTINKEGLDACIDNKNHLSKLSRERIKSEMDSLILLPKSPDVLSVMYESEILEEIFPSWKYDAKKHFVALEIANSFGVDLNKTTIYAVMCMYFDDISHDALLKLKFSRSEANSIINKLSLKNISVDLKMETKLKSIWFEDEFYSQYFIFSLLLDNDKSFIYDLYNKLQNLKKTTFPVNGKDLMSLGYSGKEIGTYLNFLKQKWIESDFTIGKSNLIKLIKDYEK